MKAIMISIKPEWVAKILNGEKTIEIRKTMPKCDLPIDVYIYCTKDKPYLANATELFTGKYACISNDEVSYKEHNLNGKVVAKFTLNKVENVGRYNVFEYGTETITPDNFNFMTCLRDDQIREYLGNSKKLFAIHISKLEIFDDPKELSEFNHWTDKKIQWYSVGEKVKVMVSLTNAPQNYCYVEIGK